MKETSKKNKTQKCMKKVCKNYRKTRLMNYMKNDLKQLKKLKEQLRKNKENMTQEELDSNTSMQNMYKLQYKYNKTVQPKELQKSCKEIYCNPKCKNTIFENVNNDGFCKNINSKTKKRLKRIGAISSCDPVPSHTRDFLYKA